MARIFGGVTGVSVGDTDISEHLVPLDPPDPVTCERCDAVVTSRSDRDHDVLDETRIGDSKQRIFIARCHKQF